MIFIHPPHEDHMVVETRLEILEKRDLECFGNKKLQSATGRDMENFEHISKKQSSK